jgi:hypothetical protein
VFGPRLPPEAVELLTVHTNDVAQIAVPPEDRAEHVVEFGERHVIGDRDQADDHRLTWRTIARRIKRLKEAFLTISSDYSIARPPTFGALVVVALPDRLRAGDVWVEGSRAFRAFDDFLLPPAAFERALRLEKHITIPAGHLRQPCSWSDAYSSGMTDGIPSFRSRSWRP